MPLFLLPVSLLSLSVAYSLSITLHSDINSNFQKVAKTVKITPIYALEGFINTLDLNPFALSLVFYFYGDLNILLQLHNTPPPPNLVALKTRFIIQMGSLDQEFGQGTVDMLASAHGVWRTQRLDAGNVCRLFHSRVCPLMSIKDAWRVSSCLCGPPHMVSLSFSKELSSFLQDLLMLSYFMYSIFFFPFYFSVCLLWINCVLITPFRKVSSSYLKVTCYIYFLMEVILNFFSYS